MFADAASHARRFSGWAGAWAILVALAGMGSAHAIEKSAGITGTATLTDNVGLAPRGQEESDLVLQMSPNFSLSDQVGRIRFGAAYSPSLIWRPSESKTTTQNTLSAFGNWEVVTGEFFVDANASVSQQYLSPFGATAVDPGSDTENRAEARTFGLSPSYRGRVSDQLTYEIRHNSTWTSSDSSQVKDNYSSNWSGQINKVETGGVIGWNVNYTHSDSDSAGQSAFVSDRVIGTVSFRPDPEFTAFVRGGYEWNNYSVSNQSAENYGLGFNWIPVSRTSISGSWDHRFYGEGYSLGLSHRMRRSAISLSAGRDINAVPFQFLTLTGRDTASALDALYTNQIPNPVQRQAFVQALIRALGLPPTLLELRNIYSNRVTLSEYINLSYAISGKMRTLVCSLFWRDTSTVTDTFGVTLPGSLALNESVTQKGVAITYSQTLSGKSAFNVTVSRTLAQSNSASVPSESTQDLIQGSLSYRLTGRTSGSMGARYGHLDSNVGTGSYTEHAIFANVSHNF
ncbi:MAG: TIGR03016 family PEP-CTERM system-associated outer membrane protein [Burkholderiales bacterium]